MLLILFALFPVLAGAGSEGHQVRASIRSLRSWHSISSRQKDIGDDSQFHVVPEGVTAFSRAHPGHVKTKARRAYPLLVSIAAAISVLTVILLALSRYFCYNDENFPYSARGSLGFPYSARESLGFAYFLAILAAANWSAMNISFHIASNIGLTALEGLFWRSVANFGLASLFVLFQRTAFLPPRNRLWLFIRSLCSVGSVIGLYIAIVQMAFVDAVALYALVPFFALLFTYLFLDVKPDAWLSSVVTVSFLGAMLIIQPQSLLQGHGHTSRLWSSLAAIGSAACAALGAVLVNAFPHDMPANLQVLWFGALGLLVAPLIMLLQGKVPHEVIVANLTSSEDNFLMILSLIVIGMSSYMMQLAYGWSLELHRAGYITTVFQCSELTLQWAVGVLVLNEALNPWRVAGVIVIVACGAVLLATRPPAASMDDEYPSSPRRKRKDPRSEDTDECDSCFDRG